MSHGYFCTIPDVIKAHLRELRAELAEATDPRHIAVLRRLIDRLEAPNEDE